MYVWFLVIPNPQLGCIPTSNLVSPSNNRVLKTHSVHYRYTNFNICGKYSTHWRRNIHVFRNWISMCITRVLMLPPHDVWGVVQSQSPPPEIWPTSCKAKFTSNVHVLCESYTWYVYIYMYMYTIFKVCTFHRWAILTFCNFANWRFPIADVRNFCVLNYQDTKELYEKLNNLVPQKSGAICIWYTNITHLSGIGWASRETPSLMKITLKKSTSLSMTLCTCTSMLETHNSTRWRRNAPLIAVFDVHFPHTIAY